jgi:D-sedoheptulose 7-phosphate isomerase
MLNVSAQERIRDRILARNAPCEELFAREALPLAQACREIATRLMRGGRVLAFGRGAYATDAMHLSVEFIHPVIVGKPALRALDVSADPGAWMQSICGADDIAIALGPPDGDRELEPVLDIAAAKGAMTIGMPSCEAYARAYAPASINDDPHVHQELFELLGHCMYESVHVFLEHRSYGESDGAASFLYPFLSQQQPPERLIAEVAESIRMKARDANALRERVAGMQSETIARAARAICERLRAGGHILTFGNGGSATDAVDFALDCIDPEGAWTPVPAIALSHEPAVLTATANDIGTEAMFMRQIIAQAKESDVAFALSTSGGSPNVVAALEEARKRGLLTVALLGYNGGEIVRRNLADIAIVVDCDYIPRIQEAQGSIYHVLREMLSC